MRDTISRQGAIDELVRWDKISDYNDGERNMIACCIAMLSALPSAQPDVPDTYVGDMISRQAAIDAICKDGTQRERQGQYSITMVDRKYLDTEILEALPSAQPGWIPVTERLPENDNDVLVTDGTDCAVAYWRTDAQAWDDCMHGWCDLYGLEVVAWMPLPKPWEGDANGKN